MYTQDPLNELARLIGKTDPVESESESELSPIPRDVFEKYGLPRLEPKSEEDVEEARRTCTHIVLKRSLGATPKFDNPFDQLDQLVVSVRTSASELLAKDYAFGRKFVKALAEAVKAVDEMSRAKALS